MDFDAVVSEAADRALGRPVQERVRARFQIEPELDDRETKATGRPVFRQTEWIYMLCPGDPHQKRFRVTEAHKQRFAREYHWYLDREREVAEGQPIEEWNQITRTAAAELKHAGIKTVEKLAEWDLEERPLKPDQAALVALAQAYLAGEDEKAKRIAELEAEVEALKAAKPKRGRPPKGVENEPTDDDTVSSGRAGDTLANVGHG